MTTTKQWLLTWTPCQPHCLSDVSQRSLAATKSTRPNARIITLIGCNDTKCYVSGVASHRIKDRRDGILSFDLEEKLISRLPVTAVFISNALGFSLPMQALAETCKADNSVFDMNTPLLLFVAIIGATVGGLLARQRRGELQRLNEQLRQINTALRRQAKIESYAPGLSYALVSGGISENEVIADARKQDLISYLKNGKNFLRNQDPERAFSEFKAALELARNLKDSIEEKKAARGLGASLQRQGNYRDAIKYHTMVLEISQREGEDSGNTEAYGAVADCYTELGDLEIGAKYYDQYISRLQSD